MNSPSSYPIVLYPEQFLAISRSKPVLPSTPEKPNRPILIKKNFWENLILNDEVDDQRINERRLENYSNAVREYDLKMKEYEEMKKQLLSETNLNDFRKMKKLEALNSTRMAYPTDDINVKKGAKESFFEKQLITAFGNKINTNLKFPLSNGRSYVPDFCYLDDETKLSIDIEIDEPYSFDSGEPIHCIGSDDIRNNYFLEMGWFILRFSESQIVNQTSECLELIHAFIFHIIEDKSLNHNLQSQDCWNQCEALKMRDEKYRENLLS